MKDYKKDLEAAHRELMKEYPSIDDIWNRRIKLCSYPVDKSWVIKQIGNEYGPRYLNKELVVAFPILQSWTVSNVFYLFKGDKVFIVDFDSEEANPEFKASSYYTDAYLFNDKMLIEKNWEITRIKRIQKHVRRWIGRPYYANGKRGLIFRKAQDDFVETTKRIKSISS